MAFGEGDGRRLRLPPLAGPLLDLLYPRVCAGCGGGVADGEGHVCWECRARFEVIDRAYCARCGDPVEGMVTGAFECGWCRRAAPAFACARSAVRYRGPVRAILHALKYGRATCLAADLRPWLHGCFLAHFDGVAIDAVVGVPLHRQRERERTYNQSALLAAELAGALRLPLARGAVERTRPTLTQTDLTAAERRANVHGAFRAREPSWIEGRRLLLVDDVMTTGATVAECSRVLKDAGAAAVYVVTVARG